MMPYRNPRLSWLSLLFIATGLSALMPLAMAAPPIDEFRISSIEQQIRDLQTTVREQARLIDQLQQRNPSSATTPSATTAVSNPSLSSSWLDATRWQQIKPGMTELQVIAILGTPSQVRPTESVNGRQLLYAMEIGRSGFLSGKVVLVNGQVSSVEIPTLK